MGYHYEIHNWREVSKEINLPIATKFELKCPRCGVIFVLRSKEENGVAMVPLFFSCPSCKKGLEGVVQYTVKLKAVSDDLPF